MIKEAALGLGIHTIVGTVVSGDQFICSDEQRTRLKKVFSAAAAEMEGAAIGHVCTMNGVPFAVLRAISDGANSSSKMDYPEFCKLAAGNSINIIRQVLAGLA